MTTPKHPKVSAPLNPVAAPLQAGSEVAVHSPPVVPVPPTGPAQGTSQRAAPGAVTLGGITLTSGDPDALALLNANAAILAARATIESILNPPVVGKAPRLSYAANTVLDAMDDTVAVLTLRPALGIHVSVTDLAVRADRVRAGLALVNTLKALETAVAGTDRMILVPGWADVRSVYHTAKGEAPGDAALAQAIEPIGELFTKTRRDVSAVQTAATDLLHAANATVKVTKANAKVVASQQRVSALAPQIAAMGHGDAASTQPATATAPTAPSTTTPSGAAPGTPPGTPGSIILR